LNYGKLQHTEFGVWNEGSKEISIYHLGIESRSYGAAGQEFGETLVSRVKTCCVGLERFGRIRTHHISRSTRIEEKLIEKSRIIKSCIIR
jgi:hypothetical protein